MCRSATSAGYSVAVADAGYPGTMADAGYYYISIQEMLRYYYLSIQEMP